ncbi:MAG TPA: toll/interleukin-1 receptor domain-containing protein [Candidatus Angelobacter sp.]|nr:toll/interleukin-1 receptor domain-containing protein [Candidatus Angelobacter sp.]
MKTFLEEFERVVRASRQRYTRLAVLTALCINLAFWFWSHRDAFPFYRFSALAATCAGAALCFVLLVKSVHRANLKERANTIVTDDMMHKSSEAKSDALISEKVQPRMPSLRVFLCHASGDKPAVRDLYRRLMEDGFTPWLDEKDLILGQNWREEIPKAVRTSDIVIVCLSREFYTAGYRQKEVRLALEVADEQPEGSIFLIPLKLEECQVPTGLTHLHRANLFEDDGYPQLVRALKIRAIEIGLRGTPALAESSPTIQKPISSEDHSEPKATNGLGKVIT